MRVVGSMMMAVVVASGTPASAADWMEYANRDYGFAVNMPGEPTEKATTYITASGASVNAREFLVLDGDGRYSVTVVDFSTRESDESGAIAFAAQTLRAKGEVLYDADLSLDGIPGHQMSVVEKNGRRMMSAIHLYNHRLYITEGSVAPGNMTPQQFQQSVGMIHPDGTVVNLVREGRAPRPSR